ncbi:hypothetical protein AOXY_G19012 [Acipenser oxyrinchus oxyrinchus]|uniref:Uncharacterized protein n=1 Tax=Acipenser oxyrinchus oxyrinchus TaxID=40147 RepID=A0AAD8D1G2_ACIOX|nr:hypothetical protein AOXY_G19012 [Acipenser oxyrinchus oxyrinchus]
MFTAHKSSPSWVPLHSIIERCFFARFVVLFTRSALFLRPTKKDKPELTMSDKLKQCRQGLAAALDRALEDVTITPPSIKHPPCPLYLHSESKASESPAYLETMAELQRRSLPVCSPGPMVSLPTAIPMDLHRNSSRSYSWPISYKDYPQAVYLIRQETSSHCKVDCSSSSNTEEALTQDLLEIIESSCIQTLEDLVGKLEFENELNRVCNNASQQQGGSLSQMLEDNVINLTPRTSEDNNMIEAVLDMAQEYDLSMYYSNLFS